MDEVRVDDGAARSEAGGRRYPRILLEQPIFSRHLSPLVRPTTPTDTMHAATARIFGPVASASRTRRVSARRLSRASNHRVVVAPLDVVKIRMQVQVEPVSGMSGGKYRGIVQCATTILKEEGARGLWAGTVPALFLWVPYTAIQFASLGEFRKRCRERGADPTAPPWAFLGGAIAGASATVCTYPFDVMRTVLAAQGSPRVYDSLQAAARGIVRDKGLAGLYAGCGVTLIEIVPASAIQFGAYAALRNMATKGGVRDGGNGGGGGNGGAANGEKNIEKKIDPVTNAACGFGAGTVARLIIHPLDVVKKRFQVAGLARSLKYGERVAPAAYANFGAAFGAILKKEGVAGFYKGLLPGVIKSAPASAITFAVYEATMVALSTMQGGGS